MSVSVLEATESIIESLSPKNFIDTLALLKVIFPDNLLLAALDIIDRGNVTTYETPWGYVYYEVTGSSGKYSVTLDMKNSPTANYCSCPAYTYAVLLAKSHVMCKHVLAVKLARRLSAGTKHLISQEELFAELQLKFRV